MEAARCHITGTVFFLRVVTPLQAHREGEGANAPPPTPPSIEKYCAYIFYLAFENAPKGGKALNYSTNMRQKLRLWHCSGEDNFTSACSDSFWEPGNYKRTTKRIEDGNKLCDNLMSLVAERAEIEKNYAKQLKAWANKWNTSIEKGI